MPARRLEHEAGQHSQEIIRQGVQDIEFQSDPTTGEIRIRTTDPVSVALVSPASIGCRENTRA
jgi:hypothetical protein